MTSKKPKPQSFQTAHDDWGASRVRPMADAYPDAIEATNRPFTETDAKRLASKTADKYCTRDASPKKGGARHV